MFAFELAMGLFLGLRLFERGELGFGEDETLLGHLGFQRLEPLVHGLQIVAQPHAAHAGRRDDKPALCQFVGNPDLAKSRLLNGERNHGVLDLLRHTILQDWLLAADFLQRQFAAFVIQLFEAIEAVATVAHHLASLADVAELLGQLQQSDFGADDLLFGRHGVLRCAGARRFATPTAPRPAPACDSPWGSRTPSVRLSFS